MHLQDEYCKLILFSVLYSLQYCTVQYTVHHVHRIFFYMHDPKKLIQDTYMTWGTLSVLLICTTSRYFIRLFSTFHLYGTLWLILYEVITVQFPVTM